MLSVLITEHLEHLFDLQMVKFGLLTIQKCIFSF